MALVRVSLAVVCVVLVLCCGFATVECISKDELANRVKSLLRQTELKTSLENAQQFLLKSRDVRRQHGLGDISFECALCGIAMNEIEGLLSENLTEAEIMNYLKNNVCSFFSGVIQQSCLELVNDLPTIIDSLENRWSVSVVCVDLGYCEKPFDPRPDPVAVPTFTVNLDLPPAQRWQQICSIPAYQQNAQYLVNTVDAILPGNGKMLNELGTLINQYYFPSEYAQEIQGCAQKLGIPYGWLTLFNLGYEVSDACTSIVAQTTDGKILHARNLDFWAGMGFTNTLKNMTIQVDMQKGGKTLFTITTFAGYVGVLSGMKPKAFSVTIDTRFYPEGIYELFYEVIAALTEKNASLVAFLSRNVFMNENDFNAAVQNLSNGKLIADVYYIVAGVSAGQGAVISRNRNNATDVWMLNAPTRWFEVETNYDHWKQPPWFDNRVVPANDAMNAMGQKDLSLDGMFKVLSTKPVMNLQTTYSILACPADSTFKSFVRNCHYPCAE